MDLDRAADAIEVYTTGRWLRKAAKDMGVRIERTEDKMPDRKTRYWELIAPAGKQFSTGEHSLICDSERDALIRLAAASLIDCTDDCDCREVTP